MKSDSVPEMLALATERLLKEFAGLPETPAPGSEALAQMAAVLNRTAERLGDNYPYFHPLYAGQMLKPPHPVARAAYALAMLINPNNHARDGGRASSEMEIEAVREIAGMFGWKGEFLGHLTSSGTIANLEALWVAGRQATGNGEQGTGNRQQGTGNRQQGTGSKGAGRPKRILASEQAHYTHSRISGVLRLEFGSVPTDLRGRMDLNALEDELRKGDVGTVVATLGTTAIGAVDPLPEILALARRYGARVHVDAAYGGYFKLIPEMLEEPARRAYAVIHEADSIVVDPHKHGLQPYGCGCVLFRDPGVGRFYKHDSPYTYFTSAALHLGEISLECSRAGAAAVALWATQQLLPLKPGGEFARGLASGRRAALELDRRVREDGRFQALAGGRPELDIVVWKAREATQAEASERAQAIFDACAERDLHLALVQLPRRWFEDAPAGELGTCLRSVLMKPEHESWIGEIWKRFEEAAKGLGN
ncbi:MAG TPA: aminotransferase class V-fold PLP-dependent enzyme [Terracidiphilus sp.]|nr:aminotransferase class V-fold PLP-dependent enzyme [Terracidiphilus sp.]